jgi:hypothetical protein
MSWYQLFNCSWPRLWRWSVMVGQPEMLRIGEAATEHEAEAQVLTS